MFENRRESGLDDKGAQCHAPPQGDIGGLRKIVIVGSPNVGKSLVFNRITGAYVTVSNYPGTTVALDKGKCVVGDSELSEIVVFNGRVLK